MIKTWKNGCQHVIFVSLLLSPPSMKQNSGLHETMTENIWMTLLK